MLKVILTVCVSWRDNSTVLTYSVLGENGRNIDETIEIVVGSLKEEGYKVTSFNVIHRLYTRIVHVCNQNNPI